jgi:hypothetical protein
MPCLYRRKSILNQGAEKDAPMTGLMRLQSRCALNAMNPNSLTTSVRTAVTIKTGKLSL